MVELQTGKKIKMLRTDNGGEYISKAFRQFCLDSGIVHQTTPKHNGVAERKNYTIMECVRDMVSSAKLLNIFCAEAVSSVVYLQNRLLPFAATNKTREEVWSSRKPSIAHIRVFGSKAYSHILKEKRT